MASPCFIGIDGGTESLRAGVFDERGRPLAFASNPYRTTHPNPGWAEQDPEEWWRALLDAVPRAVAQAGVRPEDVKGMAVDTTSCTVVALDGNGDPLRPALLWMDVRAGEQAARIMASAHPAVKINGAGEGPLSAEWFLPKVLWLKDNQPDIFERAAHFCEYQDYLNLKLTGRLAASITNVSMRWHYDNRNGGFREDFLGAIGLGGLRERLPQDVIPLGEVVGGLRADVARELGLPEGLPVAQGGADAFIAMIGLGVVRPGSLAFVTGSSHLHLGLSEHEFNAPGLWGTYPDCVIPGLGTVEGGQTSTGSIINWFRGMLPEEYRDYDYLNEKALELPPGSEGLMVLDHFQGNRTPYTDANSRGVLMGLTLKHGPEHIFRAIMEGVSYGTELIFSTMREAGFDPEHVVVCGGATRSDLFMRIHADVSGLPLQLTEVAVAPALGSAILAAVGAGHFDSIEEAADQMVRVSRQIEPSAERHEQYRELFEIYRDLYPSLSDLVHRQVRLQGRASPATRETVG